MSASRRTSVTIPPSNTFCRAASLSWSSISISTVVLFLYQGSPIAFVAFQRTRVPSLRTRARCLLSLGLGESLVGGGRAPPNGTLERVLAEQGGHRARWSLYLTSRPYQHVSYKKFRRNQNTLYLAHTRLASCPAFSRCATSIYWTQSRTSARNFRVARSKI